MNDIIKYNNDLNRVSFGKFKEKELDLFFSICFKAKEQGINRIKIEFSELRSLSAYQNRSLKRFIEDLDNTYTKMLGLNMTIKHSELSFTKFNLFNEYTVNAEERTITIQVNEKFEYILNNLLEKYTKFDLIDFVSLKSSYSKNMFKLLKQWEGAKEKEFSLVELRELLDIPVKYDAYKIKEKILNQIKKELSVFFPNLNINPIKKGRVIIAYNFSWGKKHQDINYVDDIEIEISDELQKAFEKASHNRFIQPFLTEDNKADLIEIFEDEKILIKGLIYAYKKIDKEFKRLSYLIKTIKTGAEQQTKTIKVVKKEKENSLNEDDYRQTSFDEIIQQPKVEEKQREIKEIYEDEFEQLYKEYLTKNNIEDSRYLKQCFSMPYKIIKREPKKEEKKVYTIEDIPEEKLIGKNGKKLVGGALKMRAKKILDEMNK